MAKNSDLKLTIQSYRIWHLLAMQDIRQRYRRSVLGPLWITLSTLISIFALGLVYSKIFKMEMVEYLPFLTIGIVFWTYLSSIIVESCSVFISAEGIIKQVNLPFGIHVVRMIWRNLIILAHNLVVVLIVMIYFRVKVGLSILTLLPAIGVVSVIGVSIGYLLGGVCTRFRDIPQIVTSLIQVLFYVTPVIWKPSLLAGHEELLLLNPIYYFLEMLRNPLIGEPIDFSSWFVSVTILLVMSFITMIFMHHCKKRIAYWL